MKMRILYTFWFSIIIWFCVQPEYLYSQDQNIVLFDSDFFEDEEVIEIQLKFNIKKYTNEKNAEEYLPAELTFFDKDSNKISKNLKLKSRGEFRQEHCHLPPIWLNTRGSGLANKKELVSNKIKVVTHCRGGKLYEDYILNEYLIYKMYNVITDNSFRVRLLKIKYIDTGRNNREVISWAFMIEPKKMLAKRMDALSIERDNLKYRHTDSISVDKMFLFQYMIGNTDFALNNRHNIKIFKYKDHTKPKLILVPYDFDFAGLINTQYANPADKVYIESVRERYYLGICRSDEQYQRVIEIFKQKESELFQTIDNFEFLSNRAKNSTRKYIEDFYEELNRSNFIKKKLNSTCR